MGASPLFEARERHASQAVRCSSRRSWTLAAIGALVAALALTACGEGEDARSDGPGAPAASSTALPAGTGTPTGNGISVTGTGVVSATPDTARFSFGVRTEASTAEEALSQASETTSAIVQALKDQGIDETDLQTQQVAVFPFYSSDARRVTGYTASSSVSALIRALADAGQIVDTAVGAGANEVFGPTLDIADTEALVDQALQLAVEQARARARALADAAGVELDDVVALAELGGPVAPFGATAEAAVESGRVPIEPGTQEVRVTISATFAIR